MVFRTPGIRESFVMWIVVQTGVENFASYFLVGYFVGVAEAREAEFGAAESRWHGSSGFDIRTWADCSTSPRFRLVCHLIRKYGKSNLDFCIGMMRDALRKHAPRFRHRKGQIS